MSGLVKSVKKKFKSAGLLGKLAIIAAVVWTGGVAMNFAFSPAAGLGQAITTTNTAWSTAFQGLSGAGATCSSIAPAGETAVATTAAPVAAPAVTEVAGANLGEAVASMNAPSALATEAAKNASIAGASGSASTGLFGGNGGLIAGMMGGQAVMGAMASADAEEQRKQQEEVRRSRGLFGVDYGGNNFNRMASQPIIASQQTASQALQTPAVAGQAVAGQNVARPVNARDLPALQQQGLIANQQKQKPQVA